MLYSHCSSVVQSSTAHGNNPGVLYLTPHYGADNVPHSNRTEVYIITVVNRIQHMIQFNAIN